MLITVNYTHLKNYFRGPVAIIRIVEGEHFPGDILVQKYIASSQIEQAISLLLAMNWDLNPHVCMHSLNQIVNYLFKQPLTPEHESKIKIFSLLKNCKEIMYFFKINFYVTDLIQNALGSFHIPIKSISQSVIDEYGDEVRDLTRRFFHHLLR